MEGSSRFTLNKEDFKGWAKNALIFAAPFLLVFLVSVQGGSNFKVALNVLYLYALNVVIDLLRKFIGK